MGKLYPIDNQREEDLSKGGRGIEAATEVTRLIMLYKNAESAAMLDDVAADAQRVRDAFGEWRVWSLFAEQGLLDVCLSQAEAEHRSLRGRADMVLRHICFAIDNLEDEDEVRFAFMPLETDVFVPRRRPLDAQVDGVGRQRTSHVDFVSRARA